MSFWDALLDQAAADRTVVVALAVIATGLVLRVFAPEEGGRFRYSAVLLLTHVALLPVTTWLSLVRSPAAGTVLVASRFFEAMAIITLSASVMFVAVLPRLRINTPIILREVLVAVAAVVSVFMLASRSGFNVSGLIATSTVLTAIVGLSFQDTLGNVMAGLAVQFDRSVMVGDWIKVGDVVGQVAEVRWRSTSIETRNWETVVIPNSTLVRNQFTVLGRRTGQPLQLRRWVWFNVDFRYTPDDVIDVVQQALTKSPIEGVAETPAPNCVLMEFHESYARYAARYFLTDIQRDDPTDSVVRTRIYYALKRANIPLSLPAHAIFMTKESAERKKQKTVEDAADRRQALSAVDLFEHLTPHDLDFLAEGLHPAPFARGEIITHQGAVGHWLYLIIEGEVSVRLTEGGTTREVRRLGAGNFFGEMSLLTGAPRSATVVALSDVMCYRLEKASFQHILSQRPEVADALARILAKRKYETDALKDDLDAAASQKASEREQNLLGSIRSFFGLSA